MNSKNMKIASGIIMAAVTAAAVGIAVKSVRRPRSKMQKNAARALNTVSAVTHGIANMIY